ncbi:MAG: hypothetical protein AAF371_17550 [Pseudomonadota bacterium]
MHQLGLMRLVRIALVFVAAVLVAAQMFMIVAAETVAGTEAAPHATNAWAAIRLDAPGDLDALGVVWFDGAAPTGALTTGALPGEVSRRHASASAAILR